MDNRPFALGDRVTVINPAVGYCGWSGTVVGYEHHPLPLSNELMVRVEFKRNPAYWENGINVGGFTPESLTRDVIGELGRLADA